MEDIIAIKDKSQPCLTVTTVFLTNYLSNENHSDQYVSRPDAALELYSPSPTTKKSERCPQGRKRDGSDYSPRSNEVLVHVHRVKTMTQTNHFT